METKFLTPSGKKKLEKELEGLKSKRVDVASKIKDAKELGDLSENAEYHAAKEEQGFIESRINEIERLLKSATLVNPSSGTDNITVGSHVTSQCNGETQKFEIVGTNEADPATGKISANSPLGSAFMDKKKDDVVEVNVPAGTMEYKIVDIK